MEGYTLAVDFPNRAEARELIKRLEDMTIAANGRLYFAKDSLARGSDIKGMYPEYGDWLAQADKADPEGRLATDMIRRLKLRTSK
jgi:decaprenylphospho-beta-D-ribofuranose 2-oxidase